MGLSFQQCQSDPLFSAAEVVQDSADRMESIFRLLLHEKSIDQGDCSDSRLLTSIDSHRRDLATILETTKWQLEDFERAVDSSVMGDKSQTREVVVSRHKQFIKAIREQINHVKNSLEDSLMQSPQISSEWVDLNEQDRNALALFLSGGNQSEYLHDYKINDSTILSRFLDPISASGSNVACIVGHGGAEIEEFHVNGSRLGDSYYDSMKEKNLRKVNSHYSMKMNIDGEDSFQENSCSNNTDKGDRDLEAIEAKPKNVFHENKLRVYSSGLNLYDFFSNMWTRNGCKSTRNYMKRFKDGEDNGHSSSEIRISHPVESQHMSRLQRSCLGVLAMVMHRCMRIKVSNARYERFLHHIQLNQQSIWRILAGIFVLFVLGILVFRLA